MAKITISYTDNNYDHLKVLEIEVPENARFFNYYFTSINSGASTETRSLHLPQPKPTVKKWRWLIQHTDGGKEFWMTDYRYTTEEATKRYSPMKGLKIVCPILETEVEE